MSDLVIVGAGGFGREVSELVGALERVGAPWRVRGFVDDAPSEANRAAVLDLGSDLLGSVDDLISQPARPSVVIAVGAGVVRLQLAEKLSRGGFDFPVLVHPDATLGQRVRLGAGTVVAAGARLSTNIVTGTHVHIDQNATVGHDARLGSCSRLNPQACVSGSVQVGELATIGASATVLQGIHIGDGATVGAGAVVVRDVACRSIVKGVPAI